MRAALAFTGCALLIAAGARAQDTAPAPAPPRPLATDALSTPDAGRWGLSLASFAGYDQIPTAASSTVDQLQRPGSTWGGTARFDATSRRRHSTLGFAGESTLLHYGLDGETLVDASGTLGQEFTVLRRAAVSLHETVGYSPYQSLGLFPGFGLGATNDVSSTAAPSFQQGLLVSQVLRSNLAGALSQPLTRRTGIMVDYQRAATHSAERLSDTMFQETGVRLIHQTSPNFGFHVGYAYGQTSQQQTLHHIRLGLDGRKPLSRSRRTVISFGTDTALIKRPSASLAPSSELQLLGHADLDHSFRQTWTARLSYRRDVAMLEGYAYPVLRDAIIAGLAGDASRRLTAGVNGAFVTADFAEVGGGTSEHALTGTFWLRHATSRSVSLFAEYVHYAHGFEQVAAALDLPPRFSRNSVRGGLVYRLARGASEEVQ